MDASMNYSNSWETAPFSKEARIVGKAGTGEPNTYGEWTKP